MKNLKLLAVLALATSMTVTSFGAEVKTATEDSKVEATTESKEQATESKEQATEVKETVKTEAKQEEDKSKWVTTVIKNPKIIDGRVYLTKEQFMKATGTKFIWHKENGELVTIERADFMTNIPSYNPKWDEGYILVNWADRPVTKDNLPKTVKGVKYYPLEAFKKYLNCETKYDKKAKTYTVVNKGEKFAEVTTEKINKLKVKIVDKDGKPVVGFRVSINSFTLKGRDYSGFKYYRVTDANGEFEFEVDTEKVKYFDIGADGNTGKYSNLSPSLPAIATTETKKLLRTQQKMPFIIIPTNIKELPTIYAYQ